MEKVSETHEEGVIANAHENDEHDMRRMGKKQQFRRNFKTVSITSFAVVAMIGWAYVPSYASGVIPVAGTGGAIVFFFVNFFGFLTTVCSLSEMASIAPTAGGQYHWTSEFASPKYQKILSYISGWLSSLSWLVGIASGIFLAGNLIPAMVQLDNVDFKPEPYQGYLLFVAFAILCFVIDAFFAKHLPFLESFGFGYISLAYIAIMVSLLVLSPKLTGAEVFQSFYAYGTTSSASVRTILPTQVFVFYALNGFDSAAHLSEETESAAIVIPRAMVWSYCINGVLVFFTLLVVCFCWVAPETYLSSPTGYPFLEQFTTATGSKYGAIAITTVLITIYILSAINYMASTSRQVFAFARDRGLPFSNWISVVNRRTLTPVNALIFVWFFAVLIDLIGLGSSIAFNAIISLQTLALASTYQVSVLCLIWRRLRGAPLPHAPWSLGRFGLPLNIISVLYSWYLIAYACMQPEYPVTAKNMNWAPVMFGVVLVLSSVYYIVWARKIYEGPAVRVIQS